MTRMRWLPFLALLVASAAAAAEPPCPLDLTTCLNHYQRMRERPWLGVVFDVDSTGRRVIQEVKSNSPAHRAGIRPGDMLQSIEGQPPGQWFAGKAGWKPNERAHVAVIRGGRERQLELRFEAIPEDVFTRLIGTHMVEGHLAHMHPPHGGVPDTP